LRAHTASHPRLGVVDHVSVHALPRFDDDATSSADVDAHENDDVVSEDADADAHAAAAALARRVGASLAALPLPVYFYAAAHAARAPLADVRRRLGYFGSGGAAGVPSSSASASASAPPPPDAGPRAAAAASGVACVGALPWVVNFNLLLVPINEPGDARAQPGLRANDPDLDHAFAAAAKRVAAATSSRRGGPPGVQALALRHAAGWEVACNLLDPFAAKGAGGPSAVRAFVAPLAAAEGLSIADAYCTNVAPRALAARARAADAAAAPK
jgi:hypothetical protein